VKFYLDGKQTSSVDPSHVFKFTVDIAQHNVYLRGSPDAYWRYLPMMLDEFAYFSYALAPEQVSILADPSATNSCAAGRKLTGGGCAKRANVGDILNDSCGKNGSPYSVEQCLQPLWGLNKCSSLGNTFPTATDAPVWNTQSWHDIKSTATRLAKVDVEPQLAAKKSWGACKNRSPSGLDSLCNHPPPFHTSVCLQALFLELGCSRLGSGYPASSTSPLAIQLNSLPSWRDVKTKMNQLVKTDVKGGASEGMCHDPAPDFDTQ